MKWAKPFTRQGCGALSRPAPRGGSNFVSVSDRLSQNLPQLHTVDLTKGKGTLQQVNGMLIEAQGFAAPGGHLCEIYPRHARTSIEAELVR